MAYIEFQNVSMKFPLYSSNSQSLRNKIIKFSSGGLLGSEAQEITEVNVLNNASFKIEDGDSIALIGQNGAGKSSLLRLIAGIYSPCGGRIFIDGKISTVFDIGAGMDPELSGYNNIFRIGMLQGFKKSELDEAISDIELFADLGNFISLPVRTYSSGMTMRLMFALATFKTPEILLLDEMFGTGDMDFQRKARQRMKSMLSQAKILVFASHSKMLIKENCNKILYLNNSTATMLPISELDKIMN